MLVNPAAYALAARLDHLIWFVLVVLESIVGLRVLFRALASREEGFVRLVYAISVPLVAPFRPVIDDQAVGRGGRVLEVSSLIAMLLLFIGAYLLVTLIGILIGPPF